jgi:hypothetical protein
MRTTPTIWLPTIWLIVRGICGNPDDCQEWEQLAVDWILQDPFCRRQHFVARADSYRCSALTVSLHQAERAKSFAEVLRGYAARQYPIRILCHSNGARVVRDGMRLADWPRVEEVHFVCGACDSDFDRTGFNGAMRRNRLGLFYYYVAGDDWAMRMENTLLGKLDFAIPDHSRPMGLTGPRRVDPEIRRRVIEGSVALDNFGRREGKHLEHSKRLNESWETYGHSTCWDRRHFHFTMQRVTQMTWLRGGGVQTPASGGAFEAGLASLGK